MLVDNIFLSAAVTGFLELTTITKSLLAKTGRVRPAELCNFLSRAGLGLDSLSSGWSRPGLFMRHWLAQSPAWPDQIGFILELDISHVLLNWTYFDDCMNAVMPVVLNIVLLIYLSWIWRIFPAALIHRHLRRLSCTLGPTNNLPTTQYFATAAYLISPNRSSLCFQHHSFKTGTGPYNVW